MTAAHLATLARYNRWANGRLYDACGHLDLAELSRPRASFFGSILATLNHGLVADQIWLCRLTDGTSPPDILSLDQTLHCDFEPLADARIALDDRMVGYIESLVGDLDRPLRYRTMAGVETETILSLTLMHVFNHATHHRGQVHTMLSATTVAPPSMDLIYFLREQPPVSQEK